MSDTAHRMIRVTRYQNSVARPRASLHGITIPGAYGYPETGTGNPNFPVLVSETIIIGLDPKPGFFWDQAPGRP